MTPYPRITNIPFLHLPFPTNPQTPDSDLSWKPSFDNTIQNQQPLAPFSINHDVDYVIVFRYPVKSPTNCLYFEQHVINGLQSLSTKLTRAQLFFQVRQGEKRGTLLFFVGCPEALLYKEHRTERNRDFLLGISLDSADDGSSLRQEISQADRLRLIHGILVSPEKNGGANISPHLDPFVESIMPLHDDDFNKKWISTWSKKWIIGDKELWNIRNHFGEKVAFYFAFTHFYFYWLMIPAGLGILIHFTPGNSLSIWYSLSMLVWGIAVTETWKRKQTELSTRWNVFNYSKHKSQEALFKGKNVASDQVTEDETTIVPAWKTLFRQGLTLPGVAIGAAVLTVMVTFMFTIQLFLHEYYTGPFHQYLHYAPTIGYALLIPNMSGAYNKWMRMLTNWELHQKKTSWEYSYTQKLFVANFLVRYLSLFFIAWIYIPFVDQAFPFLDEFAASQDHNMVNFQRLHDQLVYLMVTGQIVGFLTETVVPQILSCVNSTAKHLASKLPRGLSFKGNGKDTTTVPLTTGSEFMKKVNKEVALDEYNIHDDYLEMVTQFGYISMFSPVWPLAALCCIANNWVKLRSNVIKMCKYARRPTPLRAENIGPWIKNMETMVWLSSTTMASFAYLSHPTTNLSSPHAPVYMLLSVLLSEHLFAGLRLMIQYVISVVPNWADLAIKKNNYKIKQNLMHMLNENEGKSTTLRGTYKQDPVAKLWSEDADITGRTETGIRLIRNHFKSS